MPELRYAIAFLTRIPVAPAGGRAPDWGRVVLWFPLVGLLLGVLLTAVAALVLPSSPQLAAALVILVSLVLSGALHLDGLADTVDAWAGGRGDPARMLAIMKDPASGPVAVCALLAVLLCQFAALAKLSYDGAWWALLCFPAVGRCAILAQLHALPYLRPEGLGAQMSQGFRRQPALAVIAITALLVTAVGGYPGAQALIVAAVSVALLIHWLRRLLSGCTGDTLGAGVVVAETAFLIGAVL